MAARKGGADEGAVMNFLASLSGLTAHEAFENARLDARTCGWSEETLGAVVDGVAAHFGDSAGPGVPPVRGGGG